MADDVYFVDSVCWIALLNADDELNHIVETEYKKLMKSGFSFVTSTSVLNEVANALCKPRHRDSVVEFYKRLQRFQRVLIDFVDEGLWAEGWELYENRTDKEWSLTDCISFVIMQKQDLRFAITTDKHFEQAGFSAILRHKKP